MRLKHTLKLEKSCLGAFMWKNKVSPSQTILSSQIRVCRSSSSNRNVLVHHQGFEELSVLVIKNRKLLKLPKAQMHLYDEVEFWAEAKRH